MTNIWLSLKKAKKIAKELTLVFKGLLVSEDEIVEVMWNHPLYEDHMWIDVEWNTDFEVIKVHVGIAGGIII